MKNFTLILFSIFLMGKLHAQSPQFNFVPMSTGSSVGSDKVNSMNIYGGILYVGGPNTLKKFINGDFDQVLTNYPGYVEKIRNIGSDMYVVGENLYINGTSTNVTKFNGTLWEAVPEFPGYKVNDIVEFQGVIYAIGPVSDGVGNVAKLSSGNWVSLTGNPGGGYSYDGLEVYNNELYAYGHFKTINASGNPTQVKNIAKWNGSEWLPVGNQQPVSQYIRTLFKWDNKLITSNYDVWDGSQWSSMAKPTDGEDAFGFTIYKNQLFGITFSGINMYQTTTQQWVSVIPSGIQKAGYPFGGLLAAEPVESNTIFSSFGISGDYSIHKLTESVLAVQDIKKEKVSIYPNPTKGLVYIENNSKPILSMQIYSADGRTLQTEFKTPLNLSGYPKGIYFIRINYKNGDSVTEKIVKE